MPQATKPAPVLPPAHGDAREPLTHADAPSDPTTPRRIIATLREGVLDNSPVENPDHIFTHLLELYHHSGLDLAQAQLRQGKDPQLRLVADTLRHRSQRNLAQLGKLDLDQHSPGADFRSTSPTRARALQQVLQRVRRTLATPVKNNSPDQEFAAFLGLYYQSGLLLAGTQLRYGREVKQKDLAKQWQAAQQQEWQAVKAWQQATDTTR
ncbi:DUF305 domain-containing protein [Hymenobacter lucidus]|uniref:DUF305 domain-containing protein n=1 Tax=Hymenobacter lucidus TaxID=2880930 RepID=A0ABS8AYU9_9BACT|nr:DUF305 domain-containing protein [Hymenobacter lucidus]